MDFFGILILAPADTSPGFMRGVLDAINIHGGANVFWIYPIAGPNKLVCRFPMDLRAEAIAALTRTVEVTGLMHYRRDARFPHEIDVGSFEVLPLDDELPSLLDLRGANKNRPGIPAEDIIRSLRDASP